mmetsp:Transcript_2903/g.3538  ORF Transcript_2903/g.3538 Transcript_2903/m.3538 type:complete len:254 (-) Transcript_2903:185-946(-)
MANQQIALAISEGKESGTTGSTLFDGSAQADDAELELLGIDAGTTHLKIEFDNENTVKHQMCLQFLTSCAGWYCYIYPFICCCIWYGAKEAANSRKAVVTDKVMVARAGFYSCCCCCWNEATKSVSLDKITDLSISQSCIESCFNVKTIKVENASSAPGMPEFLLTGVIEPEKVRKMILAVRDGSSDGGGNGAYNMSSLNNNISANNVALANLAKERNDALNEIKDILVDVSKSLKTLNTNVNRTEGLLGNNY